ncbi:MAG: hypothetical protein ACK5G8_07500, partial [Flavobacteriales bacterium]
MNPRGGCFKAIKKLDYLLPRGLLANAREPKRGCFKAIKKLDYLLPRGLLANAREPKRGCFKAIKSNACSDVATFLFYFFPVIKASFPSGLKAKKPAFRLAFDGFGG